MAPRNGRVAHPAAENECHRFSRDIAAADHYCARAVYGYLVIVEQREHAARRAWNEVAPLRAVEAGDVHHAYGVNVLMGCDHVEKAIRVDTLGQRKLDQDAVEMRVAVEPLDNRLLLSYLHHLISESLLVGESALVTHVLHRGGVFADENGGESGHEIVVVSQFARVAAQFGFQVLADLAAVHDYRWHRRPDRNDSTGSAAVRECDGGNA